MHIHTCRNHTQLTSVSPLAFALRPDSGRACLDNIRASESSGWQAGDHSADPSRESVQSDQRRPGNAGRRLLHGTEDRQNRYIFDLICDYSFEGISVCLESGFDIPHSADFFFFLGYNFFLFDNFLLKFLIPLTNIFEAFSPFFLFLSSHSTIDASFLGPTRPVVALILLPQLLHFSIFSITMLLRRYYLVSGRTCRMLKRITFHGDIGAAEIGLARWVRTVLLRNILLWLVVVWRRVVCSLGMR